MTPPSLDHLNYVIDDQSQPTNNSNNANSTNSQSESTKSIEFNDYTTIVSQKNRKNFSSLLKKNLTEEDTEDAKINPIDIGVQVKDEPVLSKYEKLDFTSLKNSEETKKVKKIKKNKAALELKYKSQMSYTKPQRSVVSNVSADDPCLTKKENLKKQFKSLVKSINTNLNQIKIMKKKPLKKQGNTLQQASLNSLTYVHYNSSVNQNKLVNMHVTFW